MVAEAAPATAATVGEEKRAVVVGVTGRMGCGKSTLCGNAVALRGCLHFDADRIAHEAYQSGTPTYGKLIELFGRGIVAKDGQIDRQRLGSLVFGDPEKSHALQQVVWPSALDILSTRIGAALAVDETASGTNSIVLVEGALLAQTTDWLGMFSGIIVLNSADDTAVTRTLQRPLNQLTEGAIRQRLEMQQSAEEMRTSAGLSGLHVTVLDTGNADVEEPTEPTEAPTDEPTETSTTAPNVPLLTPTPSRRRALV